MGGDQWVDEPPQKGVLGAELRCPVSDSPSLHRPAQAVCGVKGGTVTAAVFSLCSTELWHPGPAIKGSTRDR